MTMPAGISTTERSQQHQHYHLKRTTSTFCISQLTAQQSALQQPKASFVAPGPIASGSSATTGRSHATVTTSSPIPRGQRRAPSPGPDTDTKRVTGVFGSGSKVLDMIHETCVDV